MENDGNLTQENRLEAEGFLKKLKQLKVTILFEIWDKVSERFQKSSSSLQESGLPVNSAVHLMKSLLDFAESQ